ncbi:MAG: hypothetical protein PHN98_08620 [Smithellaceae bacterium]|jgi:hypothetical protein|nr:hypothetical protein [Smithellaceae bacterium]
MQVSDKDKKLRTSLRQRLAFGLIILVVGLAGCPVPSPKPDPVKPAVPPPVVQQDKISVKKLSISPSVVSPGETLRRELRYYVSPEKTGRIRFTEVIIISGKAVNMELSRKVLEKGRGNHVSSFQFKIPNGLPSGEYRLITSLIFGKARRKATGRFKVK